MNNDDIQQERRVRQQHRTESLKALNDGISTRRYVCQSLWWGPYLSTTTKYRNDNMKCPTTLTTITHQVPRNYYKEYQVLIPGIKKEKRQGKNEKKRKKIKNETKTNMHALREQAESGGNKVAVCW